MHLLRRALNGENDCGWVRGAEAQVAVPRLRISWWWAAAFASSSALPTSACRAAVAEMEAPALPID